MLTRAAAVLLLAGVAAGCANDTPSLAGFASSSSLAIANPAVVTGSLPLGDAKQPHRKTMSDRVLAAIALERVTGLKPDPARLVE
ncbi:MAG: hypothetical protein AB7O57_08125 [Hyphomicrobiaceae bacterium]